MKLNISEMIIQQSKPLLSQFSLVNDSREHNKWYKNITFDGVWFL